MNATALRIVSDVAVSERRVLVVPIKTIERAPYNPEQRTKEGARLGALRDQIKTHGLMYPILITEDRQLIDGHRRLAACESLGHEAIECLVCDLPRDVAFTLINTASMLIGGKGWLEIARGGGHLPPREANKYAELKDLIGSHGIDALIKNGLGLNVLTLCKDAARIGVKKNVGDMILAVAAHRLTNKINAELRADKPDERKVAAINKLLKATN